MIRIGMVILCVALALALELEGCNRINAAQSENARTNSWTTPHVLTISDGADTNTLNPHLSNFATAANLSEMTMAFLLRWDEHNRLYPELATEVPTRQNGGVSKDGR